MRIPHRMPTREGRPAGPRRAARERVGLRRLAVLLATTLALSACSGAAADESVLTNGDSGVASATGELPRAIDYEVTSDRYRRWLVAQRALDSLDGVPLPSPIRLRRADDEEIERMERALEAEPRVRTAIASSGLSVGDYVKTSVALEQAMAGLPGSRTDALAFRDVPAANVEMLAAPDPAFRRAWDGRRFRVVDDDPSAGGEDGDSDSRADSDRGGNGRKRGHWKKGKGNGRGHGKH